MSYLEPYPHRARNRHARRSLLALPMTLFFGFMLLALGYVAYVLWPRWPAPVATDAPSLPITIAGVTFNVPPAAIRIAVQRRPGPQDRVDLAFLWPSLSPPNPGLRPKSADDGQTIDRLFFTIAGSDGTLPPAQRYKTIYPRYFDTRITSGPDGLAVRPFRDGSPYQGEDLIYDPTAPEPFILRCTRDDAGPAGGACLYDRRIDGADITVRFPRKWLNEWRTIARGIDRLLTGMRPASR